MPKTYVFRRTIPFGDIDQARILYYPRFFQYCHEALEGFAADALGISYAALLDDKRIGFPTVHIDADYRRPFPYGVDMEMTVTLENIGKASLVMRFRARCPGETDVRFTAAITKVCVDMGTFEKQTIPDWIRERFALYLEG